MGRWTMKQVEAAAPDAKSVAAARKLARPGPWSDTGSTDALVWGKCQGSGASAYQVSVDLTGPAFKCSCPSRKFPCKHGLALLMLWIEGDGSVADADAPADFAADWQAGRAERSAKQAARASKSSEPADPAAREKRRAERLERMSQGLADFEIWLQDLVTHGFAAARDQPYSWWDGVAGRLVDSQLPGLADRVRTMAGAVHARPDWATHLLVEAGRWFLATQAWANRDRLAEHELADLRTYLGWSRTADEIDDRVSGRWQVLGVHRTDDGRLQAQRTWLADLTTGSTCLALDFATVGGVLRVAQVVGTVVEGEVGRYPGAEPVRLLLPDDLRPTATETTLPGLASIDDARSARAACVAANPWVERTPAGLREVQVVGASAAARLVDRAGDVVDLVADADRWNLLAHAGPDPVDMFGELSDDGFRPLTVATGGELVPL